MKKRRGRRVILILLLLVGCAIVCVDCNADQLVMGENHDHIAPPHAVREIIRAKGRAVECWWERTDARPGREPERFVLFFIGKGARADAWIDVIADAWSDRPTEVWGMNYPGSGGSDGPARMDQVCPDALAAFDVIKQRAGDRPIFLQGGSFGNVAALSVAGRRNVSGLVLQNPPPLRELIMGRYGWWNLWLAAEPVSAQIPADIDSLVNARQCSAPAVFITAGQDQTVPPAYHKLVIDAYAGPKRVISVPQAGHDSPLTHEASDVLASDKQWLYDFARSKLPG